MAASVIRTLSGFGLTRPAQTFFVPTEEEEAEDEYDEGLREEVEDSVEDEDSPVAESREEEPWGENPSLSQTEMTDRLLRFAELISSDVQRYFGRGHDPDACDIYAERACLEVSGRQRYYADFMRVASSEQGEEPEKLGPLAELFKEAHRKRQGLPMTQRRLPSSFWTEPHPCQLSTFGNADTSHVLRCSTESTLSTPGSTLSTSNTPVSTISSSSTPDFSDLLAHWATDRDSASEFSCDYQLP
ncbi:protein PERCC1 [Salminus brasiliensis]|uniref:protein PERCC1 n=1 Tax=Salminus brasiliensis TaxID=930266 RepID=UPI003B83094C